MRGHAFRTIKGIAPNADYSVSNVKDFPDQKNISAYAGESTKYMSKLGIIKGDASGNFMPKATTTTQKAAGYVWRQEKRQSLWP